MSEYYLPIYESLPLDHFETPQHVRDIIRDSEQHSVIKSHNSYNTKSSSTLSENYVDMTETYLRSITNNGTWMIILVPTYSTKNFIGQTVMTTCVVPFVIGMLLARDSIVGIFIPSSISLPASLFYSFRNATSITNSLALCLQGFI